MKNKAVKGRYRPLHPEKYMGNVKRITYRSLWERRFMLYCDRSDQIVEWASEELHIPYVSPKDNKWHNYYPDFIIKTADGRTVIVEIKPKQQTRWAINKAKWWYAENFCKRNEYEFKVLTEKELF